MEGVDTKETSFLEEEFVKDFITSLQRVGNRHLGGKVSDDNLHSLEIEVDQFLCSAFEFHILAMKYHCKLKPRVLQEGEWALNMGETYYRPQVLSKTAFDMTFYTEDGRLAEILLFNAPTQQFQIKGKISL